MGGFDITSNWIISQRNVVFGFESFACGSET